MVIFSTWGQLESVCLLSRRGRVETSDSPSREMRLEKRRLAFGELRVGSKDGSESKNLKNFWLDRK